MTQDTATPPSHIATERTDASWVRRRDRAVTDEAWIIEFLKRAPVGTLATVHEGQPFMNTNIFVYDEAQECIYIHTAHGGRTRDNITAPQAPDQACFSIMEMGRLLPAPTALEFSVEYAGVTVFGAVHVVESDEEATDALQAILDKYAPHLLPNTHYQPPVPEELRRTTVIRMDVASWSGKKKEVGDFEGAFLYDALPILASNRGK